MMQQRMIISRAPVRVSFGGGGTDLPSFYERHGGLVVSTTINHYVYAILTVCGHQQAVQIVSSDYRTFWRQSLDDLIWDGDLAWDGEKLWFAESDYEQPSIWGIDPVASCESGELVITDTLPSPGVMDRATGIAWDGSHLLVTTQDRNYDSHLFRVEPDGTVTDSVALPVKSVSGATWDGSRICLISRGVALPNGFSMSERTIACFKLRW